MVVFSAIASRPDEMLCTLDSSWRKIFHGTSVLRRIYEVHSISFGSLRSRVFRATSINAS